VDNFDLDLIGLMHGGLFTSSIFINSLVLTWECPSNSMFDDFLLPPPPERITSKTVEQLLLNICQVET
jgi:hypothetical protein